MSKEKLIRTVQYMNDEQAEAIDNLINVLSNDMMSKGDLMKLAYESTSGIDSALPSDYVRRIQEINPSFKTHFHCMNYQGNSFGSLENVAEQLINKLNKTLSEN